jgi:hypothetical protein
MDVAEEAVAQAIRASLTAGFWMGSAEMPAELESNTYRWLHLGSSF